MTRACVRCRGSTVARMLDRMAGEAGPLMLALEGVPILACDKGHRQFVHPEFPRWLLEHLMQEDEGRLPAGVEQGLLRKHYHCGQCGVQLDAQPSRRETFRFDVALGDVAPFLVTLTAPLYRCPGCSLEQLHSIREVRKRTPEALTHAFQAAEIPAG